MGLLVSVYRNSSMDCTANGISSRVVNLTLVNVDGPFEPTENAPAAFLVKGALDSVIIVPAVEVSNHDLLEDKSKKGYIQETRSMFGGNFGSTSDSRFSNAVAKILGHRFYGAVPIHDRIEC